MPVLEFASVYTLPGISPKNEEWLAIAKKTVEGMDGVGVSPSRFLLSAGTEKPIEERTIAMIAVWPSADTHAEFLNSGGTAEALGPLTKFITMGEAVFASVEKTPAEVDLLATKTLLSVIFRIKPEHEKEFEKKATALVKDQKAVISGWDIRDEGESFVAAGKMVADQIGAKTGRIEGAKNWLLWVKDQSLIDKVVKSTDGLVAKVDISEWEDLID